MNKKLTMTISCIILLLTGCNFGMSAEELTKYYAEQAAKEAAEAASKVNQAIDENETASKVKQGVTTAGEYAQDAYEYAKDENTINSAKETAKEVGEDSKNFLEYMINKMDVLWEGVVENIEKGPAGATSSPYGNTEEDLKNASEYDFYGDYTNPFKEAKGIDTTSEGTAMDQLKSAYQSLSQATKETISNIKKNHDEKHGPSSNTQSGSNGAESTTKNSGANNEAESSTSQAATESLSYTGTISSSTSQRFTENISDSLIPALPEYKGNPYCIVNDNVPFFAEEDFTTDAFELYSELDSLGRCGVAYANICKDIMPTEERGSIGSVKPTGFIQKRYEVLESETDNPYGYLYARCHLIAYTLAGENANPLNLITGTFYFNVEGMEPFELATSYYVKSTGHHVLYRTTPIYSGNNLVANGVLMEAKSVEDDELCFCVYVYNVAPGVTIDYATGNSTLAE